MGCRRTGISRRGLEIYGGDGGNRTHSYRCQLHRVAPPLRRAALFACPAPLSPHPRHNPYVPPYPSLRTHQELAARRADEQRSALSVIAWAERNHIVASALAERGKDRLMIERARAADGGPGP